MAARHTLEVVRPVDLLERYNVTRSNVNIYNNVAVGTRFRCALPQDDLILHSREFWAKLLHGPMSTLIERHPSLGLVVGDALSARPMFLRLASLSLLEQIRVVAVKGQEGESDQEVEENGGGIDQVLEDEHNQSFDLLNLQVPLWRMIIVLHGQKKQEKEHLVTFLYVFHHVIADGRSAMMLSKQLIELLNLQAISESSIFNSAPSAVTSTDADSASFKIQITPKRPIPEPIESLINCYPSLRTLVWEASRAILLPSFAKKALESPYWAGEIDGSLDVPNETQLRFLRFTRAETQKIVNSAKERQTTVQSILATASIFAAVLVFMTGEHNEVKREPLVFATPVSLRGLIHTLPSSKIQSPIPLSDQGNYTSEILHKNVQIPENNTTSFWDMTHTYRQQVIHGTQTDRGIQELLEHFGMLALLPKGKDGSWEKFMRDKIFKDQHGRKASIKLSNLGRATWVHEDGKNDIRFKVEDAFFSQSSGVTASALTMNALTVNGSLIITTTWQKAGFKSRARGDRYVQMFKQILLAAIEPDRKDCTFADCLAAFAQTLLSPLKEKKYIAKPYT
ncbi:hypothetical protein BGZ83_012023 [Gryganskiella cystojenkinii]|nr:hypothetical protein BGZ83_012023 [Gryganskiella cystojenkinii]